MKKSKLQNFETINTRGKIRAKARELGRKIPPPPNDLFEPTLLENAAYIAKTRYAFRDEKGEPKETPREMFWRIAYYIAAADTIYLPAGHTTRKSRQGPISRKNHLSTTREFYSLMAAQKFIPNTPTMVNSGKIGQSLSACFVLPVEDDMVSILKTMSDMAMIHKMAGGTGFSFSHLRPKDDIIETSRGKSTGPVAFMQAYNDVCSQIRQGGVRRGANMGILHYTHPDVLRFAVHKVDEFSLTNFNISVTVDEAFMEKVKEDTKYVQDFEDLIEPEGSSEPERPEQSRTSISLSTTSSSLSDLGVEDLSINRMGRKVDNIIEEIKEAYTIRDLDLKNVRVEESVAKLYEICRATHDDEGYDLINPRTDKAVDRLNAKKVFDLITKLAWQYGDPGMILIDRVNNSRANPTPKIGLIEATNPCAEQPLLPYDACTLGSINLSKFVVGTEGAEDPEQSRGVADRIDWQGLKDAIHTAIHFLDNVLDMNEYPVKEIDQITSMIRRVGLGVMGWADMLVKLGIGYNTTEGCQLAEKVMQFVQNEADKASCDLAEVRGVFPAHKGSIYDHPGGIKPRNGARTTIAPTGTISLLADCSSGIEPHFALTYAKNTIEGKKLFTTNSYFLEALRKRDLESDELLGKIGENHGSVQGLDEIPEDLKKAFVVAGDIAPKDHVRMAAAFQKFTDNGISKTINFPNEATVDDVREAYWLSYELGCNMITIYRDGSRVKQVLEVKKDKSYYDQLAGRQPEEAPGPVGKHQEGTGEIPQAVYPRKRPTPQEAWGMRVRKKADVGWVYTSVFRDADGVPVEVFINIGKPGGYLSASAEVTGRLISRALKYGATLEEVASDLVGISVGAPYGLGQDSILSAFDAVGKSLVEIAHAKQLQLPITQELAPDIENITRSTITPTSAQTNGHTNDDGRSFGYTNGHSSQISTNGSPRSPRSPREAGEAGNGIQMTIPQGVEYQVDTGLITGVHEEKIIEDKFTICPDCSSPVIYAEGCRKCINSTCGWSKCS